MGRKEQALALHDRNHNCCQSVVLPFVEDIGADYETVFRMTEAMGLGLGCKHGSCGAALGAAAAVGLLSSSCDTEGVSSKQDTYALAAEVTLAFEERAGSLVCAEIRGETGGDVLMSCPDCICTGVDLVEELLRKA